MPGHKPNRAAKAKRERFNKLHPSGRKAFHKAKTAKRHPKHKINA